ncbi:uncharacterized protein [Rutidosis leptorrhynchoides]|uniref:uncharacterized protein n=1 Tax=Rutidosis leptorrhynchoides TaxID=125765 RepID=UPI003A9A5228
MVVSLGPGKFYGSSLPRPRFYTDIKYNSNRVDPPVPVLDPLMSWAEEAHWSMGGLSFHRHRLQGRIEGNVDKLRNQIEKSIKQKETLSPKTKNKKLVSKLNMKSAERLGKRTRAVDHSPSAPPAPIAIKRKRRYVGLVDEDDESNEESVVLRKWPVRKLSDEFDLVATDRKGGEIETIASRTRDRKVGSEVSLVKGKKRLRKIGDVENDDVSPSRSSPRLTKRG